MRVLTAPVRAALEFTVQGLPHPGASAWLWARAPSLCPWSDPQLFSPGRPRSSPSSPSSLPPTDSSPGPLPYHSETILLVSEFSC